MRFPLPPLRAALAAVPAALALPHPLLAQTPALDPVFVTATRTPQAVANVLSDVRVIDAATIRQAGPVTLTELLQAHGGVEIAANGGPGQLAAVFVRGANAGHVVVLIDGVRTGAATAGTASWENIPLAQIERIEVLRGPASSLYGADAIGGVIQIFTRQGERTTARIGAGRWGTRDAAIGIGRQFGDTRVSLEAAAQRTDGFSATNAGAPAYFDPDDDASRTRSLGLSGAHTFAAGHELALRLLESRTDARFDDFGNTDARNELRLRSQSVELRNRLTDGWHSLLRVARSADERRTAAVWGGYFFDTDQTHFTWQNDLAALGGQLATGLEWRREQVDSDTVFDRDSRRIASAFGSWAAGFGEHLLQASLRHDDNSQFGGRTTGNVAWGWQFAPAWRVSAGAGTAFKAPTFNDLYYPGFSNPELRPERSRNTELGLRWSEGALEASVTAFSNRIRDLIQYDFASNAPANVARARNRGATFGAGWRAAAWHANLEWTLQNAVDTDSGQRLPRRARQHASGSVGWQQGPWQAGAELVAAGTRYDNAFAPPGPRLGGYTLLNLRTAYAFAPEWSLSLRVNNVGDKDYAFVRGYNTPGRNVLLAVEYAQR
jgi:vitamin B12 transporter